MIAALFVTLASGSAAVALRASTSAVTSSPASVLRIAAPGGLAPGDVVLAGITARLSSSTSIAPPNGWTLVRRDSATSGATLTQAVYVHVATTAEPTSYTWSFGTSTGAVGAISAYAGIDVSAPVAASSGAYTGSTNAIVAPSLTVDAGAQLVGFFGNNGTKPTTPPSGLRELTDRTVGTSWGASLETSDVSQATAGSTGNLTAVSADASNSSNIGQLVALRPSGASTGGGSVPPPLPPPPPPSEPTPTAGYGTAIPAPLPPSTGTTFYVSASGSDASPGTLAAPWKTIGKALGTLQPGQTALVRGGVYPGWVEMSRSGTSTAPITLRGYPGERAVLTGRFKITGNWFRLSNLIFDGQYKLDETLIYPAGTASNIEISWNEITRAGLPGTSNHSGNGIYAAPGTQKIRILYNRIHHNGTSNRYHHGVYLSGRGHVLGGNVLYRNSAYGIQLYPDCDEALVVDNTTVANGRAGLILGGESSTSSGNTLVNNIAAFNAEHGFRTYWGGSVGSGNVATNNLTYGNGSAAYSGSGLSVTKAIEADPRFVDRNGDNFGLQSGSGAIGVAVPAYVLPVDLAGAPRPGSNGADLGAFER